MTRARWRRWLERASAWSAVEVTPRRAYVVAALLGLTAYLIIFGPGHLFGTSPHWDLPLQDSRAYLIGYRYYLHEPWHWPVFVSHTMSIPDAKSIAFTDSIPLWALVNKSVATVIPPWATVSERAYLGLWYALAFILQPCLGVAILRRLGRRDRFTVLVGAIAFLSVPAWAERYVHASLFAHFLLLWALLLYVRTPADAPAPRRLRLHQLGQLGVAAMINPYHTLFAFGVFVASVLRSRRLRSLGWIAGGLATIAVAAGFTGYFARDAGIHMAGFEVASTNVLSMVMPHRSGWVGDRLWADPTGYQYEGVAYLGLGVLVLAIAFAPRLTTVRGMVHRHVWLFAIGLSAWLFALSNHVFVGGHELFSYDVPSQLGWVTDQFRSPGRFAWLPMYLVLIVVVATALRRAVTPWTRTAVLALLVIQAVDVSADWTLQHDSTRRPRPEFVPIDAWRPLVHGHRMINILPSYDCILDGTPDVDQASLDIQYLASERAIPINGVYSARPTRDCARDERALTALEPADGVLYVLLPRVQATGYRLVQAGAACGDFDFGRACSTDAAAIDAAIARGGLRPMAPPPAIAYGARFEVGAKSSDLAFDSQWGWAEGWARWTTGPVSRLALTVTGEPTPGAPAELELELAAMVCGDRNRQEVIVRLDGHELGTIAIGAEVKPMPFTLPIADATLLRRPFHVIELRPRDYRAPSAVQCNQDPRPLGVAVAAVRFK